MEEISDEVNTIIDQHSLAFLDDFEEAFGRLPNDLELTCWRIGFADGCHGIGQALKMGLTANGIDGIIDEATS